MSVRLSAIAETFENVQSINDRLKLAAVQAKLFAQREALFEIKELTDYGKISQLQKDWDPYASFWQIAYDWSSDKEKWLSGTMSLHIIVLNNSIQVF